MAPTKPAVLVYQEYANLAPTPSEPELNVCVVGPCYQIRDFPEDVAAGEVYGTYGAANTAASGTATSGAATPVAIASVRSGAVVETASVKVTAVTAVVEVLAGACVSASGSASLTLTAVNALTAGVVAGDTLVMSNAGGTVTVRNLVRSVTSATAVVMNNQADATAYTKFRIERTVGPVAVTPSVVTASSVTLPAALAIDGKPVIHASVFVGFRALRTDLATINSVSSPDSAKALLGKYDARNPLCVGAVVALANTVAPVKVYGIATNDDAGYSTMRDRVSSDKTIYAVVPLTQSVSVLSSFKTEFTNSSDPAYALANGVSQKFRIVIGQPGELPTDKLIIDANTDGAVAAGAVTPADNLVVTLGTYGGASGTETLATLGILPGYKVVVDTVPYTVASVLSATTLTVDEPLPVTDGTAAIKFQTPAGVDIAASIDATAAFTVGAATATFTKLTDPNGTFVDAGVLPGDFIEIPADPTATTFSGTLIRLKVGVVDSNQTLNLDASLGRDKSTSANELPHGMSRVLVGGVLVAVDATHLYRIVRALDADGQVDALIAAGPGSLGNKRAWVCWPDLVDVADLVDGSLTRDSLSSTTAKPAAAQPGYYLACAVGGLVAALPSHHGLTRLGVAGLTKLYNSNTHFTDAQLNKLSNAGWMLFQQDAPDALPYIVHGLTTDVSTLQLWEAMMVKNLDYVSLAYAASLESFLSGWNINDDTIGFIGTGLDRTTTTLRSDRKPKIGSRIKSAKIVTLGQSTISDDRVEVVVEVDFPKPLNTVALHIVSL